ncbi:synaptonemal complex central element protein 2 [Notechis scutatus]|uniref:Synaptonemal complex central element protein 2 n=1 Tax=Notechis scutatus TaxID=8663 RepID=A0A6J1V3U6_9SAUR|nr:synaptonemal complex central element protein 2 [Notechis scutatus]
MARDYTHKSVWGERIATKIAQEALLNKWEEAVPGSFLSIRTGLQNSKGQLDDTSSTDKQAIMSTEEFQFQESEQEQDKSNSLFFTNSERNELSDNPLRKDSPKTLLPNANVSGGRPDSKASNYFIALDSTIESLQERTQQLIDKINENRKKDHVLMNNFRESLLMKVSSLAEKLEESVFPVYDHNNKLIQDKLQELSEIMEKIRQIENELKQVCHTVEMMYKDLCGQPEL